MVKQFNEQCEIMTVAKNLLLHSEKQWKEMIINAKKPLSQELRK